MCTRGLSLVPPVDVGTFSGCSRSGGSVGGGTTGVCPGVLGFRSVMMGRGVCVVMVVTVSGTFAR